MADDIDSAVTYSTGRSERGMLMSSAGTWTSTIVVAVSAILLSVGNVASPRPAAAEPQVGSRAPDFTLPATTGGTISLSQFRGKKIVLLEFYGADFSPV